MAVLGTAIDPRHPSYLENRSAMLQHLAELETALEAARSGGGERHVTRHHARGKLLPRERIELLVDQDGPFLELSPTAAWGTEFTVGASVVTGIGVVEGVECVVVAHDPTVHDGALNPYTLGKISRATQIALANRLPLICLVESAGAAPETRLEALRSGGAVLADLARLAAARVATVSVVFGAATGAGAYLPACSDYTIMVRNQARVFLTGPAAARSATGERADDESLGGAAMHATVSGLADFLAEDDRDGLRLARQCVRRLNHRKWGPAPRTPLPEPPKYDPQDLLSIASADPQVPFDPRELLARVLDGSDFDEFQPAYGTALVAGWGELHGFPIAVLGNANPVLLAEDADKATRFVGLADAAGTALLFLPNTSGFLPGVDAEHGGVLRQGARLAQAVAHASVPLLSVTVGAAYGAGSFGMGGAAQPRFRFSWPNARCAGEPPGGPPRPAVDPAVDGARGVPERRAEPATGALALSGGLHDDGVIDPRDTRTVLGICLSAVHSNTVGPGNPVGPGNTMGPGTGAGPGGSSSAVGPGGNGWPGTTARHGTTRGHGNTVGRGNAGCAAGTTR